MMNDKRFNLFLVGAILVTISLLIGVHFVPEKRLVLVPDSIYPLYLMTEPLPDGRPSSEWTNPQHTNWNCYWPDNFHPGYFPCAWTLDLSPARERGIGVDLSRYDDMQIKINYTGPANKVRIVIRNFNPAYSTAADLNSTKFNALQLHTKELNQENRISLSAFAAADWWLNQFNIPLSDAAAELSNAMAISLDFGEPQPPGIHSFSIEKLEFRGAWVKVEDWYLAIISFWMVGIFIYTIRRMIQLNAQTKYDIRMINQLSENNEELKEETDKFRRLSTVDPLTKLYNRFGIDQIIASLLGKGYLQAPSTPLYSLLVVDIDHFKRVNDKRGHDVGDLVLQHVAKIIQTHLRKGDYVGRWGGEEFIVILPMSNKTIAMAMAEMIREAIFTTELDPEKPLLVSASFGVSERRPEEDFATCFKRADNALYKAKAQGRNCCVYAEEEL
ncbi:MAG: GGDEF domain-containing protein [Gammaproteobacteria bacterium]|nr:MAG: GGDEF domain-containing protein [Gammaproteobacteria bacterium]